MKHVSILLVHYNTDALTHACVRSLSQLKRGGFRTQVIIVDNGSLKPYRLPPAYRNSKLFSVVRSDSNLGFTGGNNLGIHLAVERYNSQYIFLLNNDTTIAPNALQQLLMQMEQDASVGILCPKIYFSPGKEFHRKSYQKEERGRVLWYAGGTIDWNNLTAFHRGVDEVDRGQFDTVEPTDFATGCALLIRREVLEKVGYLDKRYFMYFEDVDLSLRVKKSGYTIMYCPKAIVWHMNAGSSGGAGSNKHVYYQERNRYLLFESYSFFDTLKARLRLQLSALFSKNRYKQRAVFDYYIRSFGKQPTI